MKTIVSWNVNGIRAAAKKGLFEWFSEVSPDVLCLQETKAHPGQLPAHFHEVPGYTPLWASAKRKGYSGVAVYTRQDPEHVRQLGVQDFDDEGRTLIVDYSDFTVVSSYFPNSRPEGARLDYKLAYCSAMMELCAGMSAERRNFIVCGDYNIAHKPIDLARPAENEKNPGYLPEERAWMDDFVDSGMVDTFRTFNREPGNYTWWSYRMSAREKNIGWRLDYHCVPHYFADRVTAAGIESEVMGSDHCPVTITADV